MVFKTTKVLLNLILLVLFLALPPAYAEQPTDTSEQSFEIVIGVTTYQDILEGFGSPLFTTKTEEGNQVWGYRNTKVESIDDDSVPEQDATFLIEFGKDGRVSSYQIMTLDEVLTFKEERGCEPLLGNKEWFSWSEDLKLRVVKGFIQEAKENGIIIKQSPEYYVKEVDTILSGRHNPDKIPIGIALRVTAIMDGDWDDGSGNKLGIASRYLGYEGLKMMKERSPEMYERLLEESK